MIICGIDAGGSTTKCVLLNETGAVLAETTAGPANYQAGMERAIREIQAALSLACVKSGVDRIDVLGIGLAGAGRPQEFERFKTAAPTLPHVTEYFLTNDGEIAVLGAHKGAPGLIVIAGTGSIVYGRRLDGRMVRCGGWGSVLGDEGSGYWIGLQAAKAAIVDFEGRGPATLLTSRIMAALKLEELWDLRPLVYQNNLARKELASLTPLVIELARRGDEIAERIIQAAVAELALLVKATREKLDFTPNAIAVMGGLFRTPLLRETFTVQLPELKVFDPQYPAVYGAAIYGAIQAGIDPGSLVR